MTTLDPTIEVIRAIAELRRGAVVRIIDGTQSYLFQAAELLTPMYLSDLFTQDTPLGLVITEKRAVALGIAISSDSAITDQARIIACDKTLTPATIKFFIDPVDSPLLPSDLSDVQTSVADKVAQASITLAKLARLLPATLILENADTPDTLSVHASSIESYVINTVSSLQEISRARVPLENIENAQVVAFRPKNGGVEHLAILIGEINTDESVLVRLHSECFTGDLIGSLRCDCGHQLRGAIDKMVAEGSGILLYLAQEGRGIGLVNKLRSYQLQDAGLDTVDANLHLGFDSDERHYLPAAKMLQLLGVKNVRLMTNNPAKAHALEKFDITVIERVSHAYPPNRHNKNYLQVKATKSGHLFNL